MGLEDSILVILIFKMEFHMILEDVHIVILLITFENEIFLIAF